MSKHENGCANCLDLHELVPKRSAKRINRRLKELETDVVRDGTEARIAAATFYAEDAGAGISYVPVGLAACALVVADGLDNLVTVTAMTVLVLFFGAGIAPVYLDKRNREAARAVLHYRIDREAETPQLTDSDAGKNSPRSSPVADG